MNESHEHPRQTGSEQTEREGQAHQDQHGIDTAQPVDQPAQQWRSDHDDQSFYPCQQESGAGFTRLCMSEAQRICQSGIPTEEQQVPLG